ncbi:glucosamine 6-phosphate N-acetyltransferase, partial [Sphaerosporella brunnea]
LFPASIIPARIHELLPEGYTLRPLQRTDYSNGFLDVLRVLTTVGDIPQQAWEERYDYMAQRNDEYFVICVCDGYGKVVGVGTLVIERKFLRNLGSVGHVEDISVAKEQQGKRLGWVIIQALDAIAEAQGCYKAFLDCSEANRGFYEKCGYSLAGVQM